MTIAVASGPDPGLWTTHKCISGRTARNRLPRLNAFNRDSGPPTELHALVKDGNPALVVPGVYDSLSARLAAISGHQALVVGGYSVAASSLGLPDLGIISVGELAEAGRRVVDASPGLPVLVDGDTGGGGPVNVIRTVRDYRRRGIAGIFLEDQTFPKRCGHLKNKSVISAEEHAAKIAAARDAAAGEPFFIVARTDAAAVHGLDEAIRRANIYADAGASATFVEAPDSIQALARIGIETKGALRVTNFIPGGLTPSLHPEELGLLGFHFVLHPLEAIFATACALGRVYSSMKGNHDESIDTLNFDQFNDIINVKGLQRELDAYALVDINMHENC